MEDHLKFNSGEASQDYAAKLRTRLFRSQRAAAKYFGVNHVTIGRYERIDANETVVPIWYLAALAVMLVERGIGTTSPEEPAEDQQRFLLEQLNKVRQKYTASYNYRRPFRTWDELVAEARTQPGAGASDSASSSSQEGQFPHPYQAPPLPPQGVFGREETLARISTELAEADKGILNLSPVGLFGMGGIGKTTLAASIGRRSNMLDLYPGGVLWAELGQKPLIRQILITWGRLFGLDLQIERSEDACEDRLRDHMVNRQMLIVIDDVWDADLARHFLLGGPMSRTLFTTREELIAYALTTPDRVLRVDVLSETAAFEMLAKLAPRAVAANRSAARLLCAKLEFLPLAIRLAAPLIESETDIPERAQRVLAELAEQRHARLRSLHGTGRLTLAGEKEVSLYAILAMSVDRLDAVDKARFAMASVFGGEPLTWTLDAAAHVWECSLEEAQATTSRFMKRALVDPRPDGRYWMHAMLVDYASELRAGMDL